LLRVLLSNWWEEEAGAVQLAIYDCGGKEIDSSVNPTNYQKMNITEIKIHKAKTKASLLRCRKSGASIRNMSTARSIA